MPKYLVELSRMYLHHAEICIEADSAHEAGQIGLEMIDDTSLSLDCALTDQDQALVLRELEEE